MTSYQKLKAENERLKQDIYTLIRKPDTIDGFSVRMKYEMSYKLTDVVMTGDIRESIYTKFDGLLTQIKTI